MILIAPVIYSSLYAYKKDMYFSPSFETLLFSDVFPFVLCFLCIFGDVVVYVRPRAACIIVRFPVYILRHPLEINRNIPVGRP